LQALEDARANGEMIVLSSYAANGRRVMIIELEDAPDEASRLEIAAAGLQTKATAVRSAVAPVLEVEAPK
jgi:Asp/Glu/hydantoin racemase